MAVWSGRCDNLYASCAAYRKRCKVIVEPGAYEKQLRYARPGEMSEVQIKAEYVQSLGDVAEILVDIREA